jgi:type IV pilus assembly protein PilQ
VKELRGIGAITAATIALVASQPASAAPTQINNVRLAPSGAGVNVVLETQGSSKAPQVFNVNRGNTWTAYVFNAQIARPFQQNNPAPGIASISVSPMAGNGVQVVVVGQAGTPTGQVASRNAQGVIFNVASTGGSAKPSGRSVAQAAPGAVMMQMTPRPPAGTPVAPFVPNSQIQSDGAPFVPTAPVPPLMPRAVAPPVGDVSTSQYDTSPTSIDLGTNERIPRLVLRDAPVREVLSLLAKAAGLNLAYSEAPSAAGAATPGGSKSGGPTISLDIENEAVQDVFNYVLRIACVPTGGGQGATGGSQCASLEASRSGRTIFVGPKLPNAARGVATRSLRLNQIPVGNAVNFLVGLGAESAVTRDRQVRTVAAQSVSQLEGATGGQSSQPTVTETTESKVEIQRANFQDSTPLLRGMQVLGDERTNSVTLVGTQKQIEIATNQLIQLDSRRRIVAVNVKVIDVNLLALNRAGVSFSFGVGNSQIVNTGGIALLNFGKNTPGGSVGSLSAPLSFGAGNIGSSVVSPVSGGALNFVKAFSAQLQAAVTNGNAKILTDPTLVIQEGQTSTVNLTQEVITNFKQETTFGTGTSQTTVTVEKKPAGLILPIKVDRIDDNGFVSLSVAPSISQPERNEQVNVGGSNFSVTLLSERKLESGQIRLRDGQTLVLSGIIQDQERVNATKVPILGDLPILGALFRRTERSNERREVIVLLTPQVVDDSDRSTFGYGYVPGKEVREYLQQQR